MKRSAREGLLAVLVAAVLVGCSGDSHDGDGQPTRWFEWVRDNPTPQLSDMQLDLDGDCALKEGFEVGDVELDFVGSGSALYGDHQGVRYQCAWTGPDGSGRPANVRLEVLVLNGDGEVALYEHLLDQRPTNSHQSSRGWMVAVASDQQAASTGEVYVADVVVPDEHGVVHMLLELTDLALAGSFDRSDVADLLTGLLDAPVTDR